MNYIDIIAIALVAFAAWRGWCSGIIMQLSAIVGIIVGAWVANNFSHILAGWLSLETDSAGTYIASLVIVMLCVIIILWFINKLLIIGGLSVPIRIFGSLASILKAILIMALLQSVYLSVGGTFGHKDKVLKKSYSYEVLKGVSDVVFPYIKQAATKLYVPVTEKH